MELARIVVLISGNGSNLQAIIDACESKIIPATVVHVISNREGAYGLERAANAGIKTSVIQWDKKMESRRYYDERLAIIVKQFRPTLVVLAGWMYILGDGFLKYFNSDQLINLHPALPNTYPGAHAIEDAFGSKTTQSGVMVHTVVKEVDAGTVLAQLPVARFENDTFDEFANRIRYSEKTVLINGIANAIQRVQSAAVDVIGPTKLRSGKVRDIYNIGYGMLMIDTTDRCSAFDRFICNIPQKGNIVNRISEWWFRKTRHIIENHMIMSYHQEFPVMIVKRCKIFPIEFVVRGYITGTTNTAMWTLYSNGQRKFGDVEVSDGLHKNEQLEDPIVTPTTKSDTHDEPIDREEIIKRGLMTSSDYDYCHHIALELFHCGQTIAAERGLILADTKYEFGVDPITSRIILADELHTCDSSRYWKKDTYYNLFEAGLEPERFDKDMIRLYVRDNCDPYNPNEVIPEIPAELIAQVANVYISFYSILTGDAEPSLNFPTNQITLSSLMTSYFTFNHPKRVIILTDKVYPKIKQLVVDLRYLNVYTEISCFHPHKHTAKLLDYVSEKQDLCENNNIKILYVVYSQKKMIKKSLYEIVSSACNTGVVKFSKSLSADHINRFIVN